MIVDLSRMNRILDLDPELGLVTLEPGVTQKQLVDYLDSNGLNFFVPTTGAGPSASIVGNALERGFGMTPDEDHFRAVTSIRAVLPDGEIYQSYMSEVGCPDSGVWRWGIGPYLDGLFTQANFGIVTAMRIALVTRPRHIEVYLFTLKQSAGFSKLVESIRDLQVDLRGHLGGVKVINQRQVELTIGSKHIGVNLAADFAWMGFGVIRCKPSLVRSIRKEIWQVLKPQVSRLVFVNEKRARLLRTLYRFVPGQKRAVLEDQIGRIDHLLDIVNGVPRGLELKLVYRDDPVPDGPMDLARDGVDVIWYAPVLPLKVDLVARMVEMIKHTLAEHGFDQALSFTTIHERCAIGVIPIIFRNPEQTEEAHACFRDLWSVESGLAATRIESILQRCRTWPIPIDRYSGVSRRISRTLSTRRGSCLPDAIREREFAGYCRNCTTTRIPTGRLLSIPLSKSTTVSRTSRSAFSEGLPV